METSASNCEHSAVFPSLPLAIKWLRDRVQQNQSLRFQVRHKLHFSITVKKFNQCRMKFIGNSQFGGSQF